MLSTIGLRSVRMATRLTSRSMATTTTIPSDKEQQTGPRKVELEYAEKYGEDMFNRDSIMPDVGTGTLANPIMIPSGEASRVVGFECPTTHATFYFTLEKNGMLHYIKQLGLFFMLFDPKEVMEAAAASESS